MDEIRAEVMRVRHTTQGKSLYKCGKCHDTGYIIVREDGHNVAKACDCGFLKAQEMERQMRYADIPEAFRDMRLETFRTRIYSNQDAIKETQQRILYWMQNREQMIADGTGLYLVSDAKGSGKTRMAASIANELMHENGYPVKFATSIQIINEIKATWNEQGLSESQLLNQLTRIKVLVLDDFGTETVKDWIAERVYHIVNERYVNKLPTIYTSNKTYSQLAYDDRITNRIMERSIEVPFPEESIRKRIAEEREKEMKEVFRERSNT